MKASPSTPTASRPPIPHKARAGIPLGGPIYGYKGFGLAFMVDLLCGAMNGMTFGRHINSMYEQLDQPRKIGHLLMAIDPGRFAGADTLEDTWRRGRGPAHAGRDPLPRRARGTRAARKARARNSHRRRALKDMREWSGKLGVAFFTRTA
jgi:ureidoglycolate dehydrogenase (NAD+)